MRACADLVAMHAHADTLLLLFRTADGQVPVRVPLEDRTAHALRHLQALQAHKHGCGQSAQVHVDLLLRTIETLGAAATRIVVRPGSAPAFWLRVGDRDRWTELDLDVLDAASLLLARRLPIELTDPSAPDWDIALQRLVGEQDQQ